MMAEEEVNSIYFLEVVVSLNLKLVVMEYYLKLEEGEYYLLFIVEAIKPKFTKLTKEELFERLEEVV